MKRALSVERTEGETPSKPVIGAWSLIVTAAISAGELWASGWILARVYGGSLSLVEAVELHVGVVFVLILAVILMRLVKLDIRLAAVLAASSSVMGPFAGAGTLLATVLWLWYSRAATPFQEWYRTLFPDPETNLVDELYYRLRDGGESQGSELAPFVDILRFGSVEKRQQMLATVAKNFKPVFAPILQRALQNESNAVRVQAAAAITLVETRFVERVIALTARLKRDQDDPESHEELARLYDAYAYTGLLEPARESENRALALEHYRRYLVFRPDAREPRLAIGRLLVREGAFEEAARWFEPLFDDETPEPNLALYYMECLFRLGRYDGLRRLALRYRDRIDEESFRPDVVDATRYWADSNSGFREVET